MKQMKYALLGLALASATSHADCTAPDKPQMPDGATSALEDMLAGQKAVKTFQTANLEYMACLEAAIKEAEAAAEDADQEAQEAAQARYDAATDAYNAAVSAEEEVAGQFNTEIREYKAANPG